VSFPSVLNDSGGPRATASIWNQRLTLDPRVQEAKCFSRSGAGGKTLPCVAYGPCFLVYGWKSHAWYSWHFIIIIRKLNREHVTYVKLNGVSLLQLVSLPCGHWNSLDLISAIAFTSQTSLPKYDPHDILH